MDNFSGIIEEGTVKDIYNSFEKLVSSTMITTKKIEIIKTYITNKHGNTYTQQYFSHAASRALMALGIDGLNEYINLLNNEIHIPYFSSFLRELWEAGQKDRNNSVLFSIDSELPDALCSPLSESLKQKAKRTFYDYIKNSLVDTEKIYDVINLLHSEAICIITDRQADMQIDIFRIISESSIRLSSSLINEYKELIYTLNDEEKYQKFFSSNPVFLHPLGRNVYDKQQLGSELITDFVIQTLDSDYYLVEIEKPQDKIFTKSNDFTANFTHALGQVIDFLDWIESNIAYAGKKLPNISSPKGLLIIGTNKDLTPLRKRKLKRFSEALHNINILTYEDILDNARALYSNMIKSYI